ncbi:translation factor GTPase family protein [Helicovermis profundi]|uniref:TetM/TetW/TetO/TetS family tetracycline resistance ribosomal protection protein n=1 Tax=Helicovermis profundi TaxID=3065157 RepID=A0AAU9ECV8_9FIRM|nr:TetM/TetW/TetO/TetS family tetracycline resistance ribosomal protection protein [Clostridia bacterium S502]
MKKLVIGILAHVDAGKTTLSESLLYLSGKIRRPGRVDNKNAYLDTFTLEKSRGITIFSKQAVMNFDDLELTLLDTPGHVDFSAEMERTLQVLDYAILVVSGADGIQSHTKTLWNLLEIHKIPTFIFINKMDQSGTNRQKLMIDIKKELSDNCIPFDEKEDDWYEQIAMCDEEVMESYLNTGNIELEKIRILLAHRNAFPVYFGSALRQIGVEKLIEDLKLYSKIPCYSNELGGKIYKITRDSRGERLTHIKITGGSLKVKDTINTEGIVEKINQIRIYSGEKYNTLSEVEAGTVCALTGLNNTKPGEAIGKERDPISPLLEPILSYQLILPEAIDELQMLPNLKELEEEEPTLRVRWNKDLQSIYIHVMGDVQIEVLQSVILERYGILVTFDKGKIVYKETISTVCEGVGHFEPLRHYAEVHLLLKPGERGSGIIVDSICKEDILEKNWQRLILSHLKEKEHVGVLTGSYITDIEITLVSGKSHNKHTSGGDFREATYRALRQGLKEAETVLLEPYYKFRLELPEKFVGRAMTDIDKMHGQSKIEHADTEKTVLTGIAPVSTMRNYQQELNTFTKGYGKLFISIYGYDVCYNFQKVIEDANYDSERDIENPTSSVFCANGSGYIVPWNEVKKHMHVENYLKAEKPQNTSGKANVNKNSKSTSISLEEIDAIINSTYYSNKGKKNNWKKQKTAKESYYETVSTSRVVKRRPTGDEYLLVDGYNIIFDWDELKNIAKDNLESARIKLIDILNNYQGVRNGHLILVFDAYKNKDRTESTEKFHNISVVFTGENQSADHYIEKFAHDNQSKYRITVASSDGLVQKIIRGLGANILSARELREDVLEVEKRLHDDYLDNKLKKGVPLEESISEIEKAKLKLSVNTSKE